MRNSHKIVIALGMMSLTTAASWAHGGHRDHDSAAGEPGDAKKVTRTVNVGADEYEFDMHGSDMTFKTGETVKFVVTNKGTLMHEFTIGTPEEQAEHQKMMAGMSDKDGHMAHDDDMDSMATNSVHVRPGETKTLVWTFTHPGTFEYGCNFPGHAMLGMEGKIVVQ